MASVQLRSTLLFALSVQASKSSLLDVLKQLHLHLLIKACNSPRNLGCLKAHKKGFKHELTLRNTTGSQDNMIKYIRSFVNESTLNASIRSLYLYTKSNVQTIGITKKRKLVSTIFKMFLAKEAFLFTPALIPAFLTCKKM